MRHAALMSVLLSGAACLQGPAVDTDDSGDTTGATSTSETSPSEPLCGDDNVDPGEACDDGNEADDDSCPSGSVGKCKGEASCGDGIVWTGEEACDGGEGCEADCTLTPTECGNGIPEVGEACDDGNYLDDDACPSSAMGQCKAEASCGDGFTWTGMEACDDGNTDETDACPSGAMGNCLADAACGDGFVRTDMEACDDANMDDTDACPSGAGACQAEAMCGDGYVQTDVEDCDDMNAEDLDACNNACASPRWVFVTNSLQAKGNLSGISGADLICQTAADSAGLDGKYMAWLTGADSAKAPVERFNSTGFVGWYRLPTAVPTPVALGWAGLTGPNDEMPPAYLENAIFANAAGEDVVDVSAWTNTNPDGTQQTNNSHCNDWMSSDGDVIGRIGRAKQGVVTDVWTLNKEGDCNVDYQLYCFQVE